MRNLGLTALATLALLLLAGCSGRTREIEIKDDEFEGGDVTLAVGTEIEFDNEGNHLHSVTIHKVGAPNDVPALDKDLSHEQSVEFTFSEAGTYHVWCKHHGSEGSGMHMTVTVQ